MEELTIIFRDLNTHLSVIERTGRPKTKLVKYRRFERYYQSALATSESDLCASPPNSTFNDITSVA